MAEKMLLILGAGGHGKSVAEAALMSGEWQKVAFLDDCWPELREALGWPVVGHVEDLARLPIQVDGAIAAVGNNAVRERWMDEILAARIPLASIIHPRAFVSPSAQIGEGCSIMALAMVGVDVEVGRGAIINAGATVDHDAAVGDFAHLGVGVQIAGGVRIGARSWLQAGCCAGYHVVVAEGSAHAPGTALQA